ncbi:MAG TPA: SHOCT domain-containing protein [Candidatus Binatia bacterium]|nr:SHOCT domain-containing protein [Candidatus Binatia bacterium]
MDGNFLGVFVLGLVIFFAVVFVLFWLITTVVRVLGPERSRRAAAMALLRERLARGEISPAEYEEARRILGA